MDARKPRERLLGPALRAQPDRRLVALAREGSEAAAAEEIVRRYRAALVRYAGAMVGATAAEDVVQEALAKGVTALARADEDLRLRPWLYAIVRNTALNHLRDAGPGTEQLDESHDGVEQPPQALERRERVRSLVGGLQRLPRQQRQALVGRELEGRSHAEIGAELGVSSGAARQLIFRARASLRAGFGSLLPVPLLRWLAEGGGDGTVGVAAGAGGGAVAAKAAVAIFAASAAVTAGVAIDHGGGRREEAPVAVAPAGRSPEAVDGTSSDTVAEPASSSGPGPGAEGRDDHGRRSGRGGADDSSASGSGDVRVHDSAGGPGPSGSSGTGSESGRDDARAGDHGGGSGRGSSGPSSDSGDGSGSGSSRRGRDGERDGGAGSADGGSSSGAAGTSGGDGSGGSGASGGGGSGESGSSGRGGDTFGRDGSTGGGGSSQGTSSGGSGSGGGSPSRGGSDDLLTSPSPAPTPTPAPTEVTPPPSPPAESGSGGPGPSSGGGSSETSRDLSGSGVSQGPDDPD